jgi:hypothetical protein
MIDYLSTKILLIGIIKNIIAAASLWPLFCVSFDKYCIIGLPIGTEETLRAFGEDREACNNNCDRPRTFRNRLKVRSSVVNPALESFPIRKIN